MAKRATTPELVDRLIAYEAGELTDDEVIELFQELINNGLAWQLQGHYGRMTRLLIEQGLIRTKETH
jgi:hypothetical protein